MKRYIRDEKGRFMSWRKLDKSMPLFDYAARKQQFVPTAVEVNHPTVTVKDSFYGK